MGAADGLGLKVGALVIGLCLGAGGVAATRDEPSFDPSPPPAGASAEAPTTTAPFTSEDVHHAVEIEAGLTAGNVFACDVPDGGELGFYPTVENCPPDRLSPIGDTVSYGVVLENTSDHMLVMVPVTLTFYDDAGAVVDEPAISDSDLQNMEVTVDVIRPGQRVGFGGMSYLDRPGATRVEVAVGEPGQVLPQVEAEVLLGAAAQPLPLTSEVQSVSSGDSGEPVVHFTITSTGDELITTSTAYAILRDEGGHIIGGIDDRFFRVAVPPGGTNEGELVLDDPMAVPGIDPAQVEVYVGPVVI